MNVSSMKEIFPRVAVPSGRIKHSKHATHFQKSRSCPKKENWLTSR